MSTKRLLKLKALRVEKQITQREIAKELGISEKSYGEKENGYRSFTLDEMYILSKKVPYPYGTM